MSNIGKKIINIPKNIEIKIINYNKYKQLIISSKNRLIQKYINFPSSFKIQIDQNQICVLNNSNLGGENLNGRRELNKELKFYGTLNSFINQMIKGIHSSFKQKLNLNGVGYKIEILPINSLGKSVLSFQVGFSHPVLINIPQNIKVKLLNSNSIELESDNYQLLTQFIHQIIQIKPAYKDKYKKKGFEIE